MLFIFILYEQNRTKRPSLELTGIYKRQVNKKSRRIGLKRHIDRHTRNMETTSRLGDPSLSSYLYILGRLLKTLY